MQNISEENITQAVLTSMAGCKNPRLLTVMTSLVQHLHAFARDVQLTEDEWWTAIKFLTDTGHITDDKRQEFILLSDVLGLSMLVTAQNARKPAACTEATVFGPFFLADAPTFDLGADISGGAKGAPCFVRGHVRGANGEPVPGALMDVWQCDEDGFYDVQKHTETYQALSARGRLHAEGNGSFHFRSILAQQYPIPHDGPVGKWLEAVGRHPWRPAHLHFMIEAKGYERLITHVFRRDDPYLESDAVFGVRSSLVTDWIRHEPGTAPDGTVMTEPYYTLDYDFVLNPKAAAA